LYVEHKKTSMDSYSMYYETVMSGDSNGNVELEHV